MNNRLILFMLLKKAAYSLADERRFFKLGIKSYDISLNSKERYITESIMRRTWDYHNQYGTTMTDDTQELLQIMSNCIFAGMFASKYVDMDEERMLSKLESFGIDDIELYVEQDLGIGYEEAFGVGIVAKGLANDMYYEGLKIYSGFSSWEECWEYYKDLACVMFELGAIYFYNRV